MTLTRWKLLAGLLGLSMGGVAAVADPPCRTHAAHLPPPCPTGGPAVPTLVSVPVIPAAAPVEAVQVGFTPPVDVPAPKPGEVPPTAVALPPVPAAPGLAAPELPALPAEPAKPVAPPPRPVAEKKAVKPADAAPPVIDLLPVVPGPVQASEPVKAADPPQRQLAPPVVALDPAPLPPPAVSQPQSPAQRLDPPTLTPAGPPPAPTLGPPEAVAPPAGTARVVLKIGAGQPRFEVVSGDDTLLKVVSDKVDVTSPSGKGEPMSALKATGGVQFSAPGCEGTCAELTVLPGAGLVELAGGVRVKCKQGKGETEILAAKLTVKLGAAPGYAVSEPAGAVNASFPPARR